MGVQKVERRLLSHNFVGGSVKSSNKTLLQGIMDPGMPVDKAQAGSEEKLADDEAALLLAGLQDNEFASERPADLDDDGSLSFQSGGEPSEDELSPGCDYSSGHEGSNRMGEAISSVVEIGVSSAVKGPTPTQVKTILQDVNSSTLPYKGTTKTSSSHERSDNLRATPSEGTGFASTQTSVDMMLPPAKARALPSTATPATKTSDENKLRPLPPPPRTTRVPSKKNQYTIISHIGPLSVSNINYCGSAYSILLQWDDGTRYVKCHELIAKDDPETFEEYAIANGLADDPEWKKWIDPPGLRIISHRFQDGEASVLVISENLDPGDNDYAVWHPLNRVARKYPIFCRKYAMKHKTINLPGWEHVKNRSIPPPEDSPSQESADGKPPPSKTDASDRKLPPKQQVQRKLPPPPEKPSKAARKGPKVSPSEDPSMDERKPPPQQPATDVDSDTTVNVLSILSHEGPLTSKSRGYKKCTFNVHVVWDNEERTVTNEPLNKIKDIAPEICAKYGKRHGLLNTTGWKTLKEFLPEVTKPKGKPDVATDSSDGEDDDFLSSYDPTLYAEKATTGKRKQPSPPTSVSQILKQLNRRRISSVASHVHSLHSHAEMRCEPDWPQLDGFYLLLNAIQTNQSGRAKASDSRMRLKTQINILGRDLEAIRRLHQALGWNVDDDHYEMTLCTDSERLMALIEQPEERSFSQEIEALMRQNQQLKEELARQREALENRAQDPDEVEVITPVANATDAKQGGKKNKRKKRKN
jgi:hypothetical protein